MAIYEPPNGSIGSWAVKDPDFRGYKWIYGTITISELFGPNQREYWTLYRFEIFQFQWTTDSSIFELGMESQLDNGDDRLPDQLRYKLKEWIEILETCDALIANCEDPNIHDSEIVRVLGENTPQTHNPNATTNPTLDGAPGGHQSVPAAHTLPEPRSTSDRHLHSIHGVSQQQRREESPKRKKSLSAKLSQFLGKGKKNTGHHNNLDNALQASDSGQESTLERRNATTNAIGVTDSSHVPDQGLLSSVKKIRWAGKRDEFIGLLRQLNQLASHFSDIQPRRKLLKTTRLLRRPEYESQLQRYKDAGERLRSLIQSLEGLQRTDQVAFELMLHNDPHELQSDMKCSSAACRNYFQPGSAVFYMRLQSASSSPGEQGSTEALAEARYIMFSVSSENTDSEVGEQIDDVHLLINSAPPTADRRDWAVYLGHINRTIRVFSDSTTHSGVQSFVACIADRNEQTFFRKLEHAAFKARLAFVAAASLLYILFAEGPRDLQTQDLQYYPIQNGHSQVSDIKKSRINPFISLRAVGATATQPSSEDAIAGAAGVPGPEATMIKSLGILLFEIGSWNNVEGREISERIRMVKREAGHLGARMTSKYCDVIDSCFDYNESESENARDWVIENVLMPLKSIINGLERVRFIPT